MTKACLTLILIFMELFFFVLAGTKPGGSSGYAEYAIVVNEAPQPGICSVNPRSGYALQTTFIIACEMFVDEDVPLTYTVVSDAGHPSGDGKKGSNHLCELNCKLYCLYLFCCLHRIIENIGHWLVKRHSCFRQNQVQVYKSD